MTALRPFLFDPLIDWVSSRKSESSKSGETVNEKAVESLKAIEKR